MIERPGYRLNSIPLLAASLVLDLICVLLFLLLVPWLLFLIIIKGRGVGSLKERLGAVPIGAPERPRVWFHAVSVGELEAALPLVRALEAAHPEVEVVISTTTTTAQSVAVTKAEGRSTFLFPLDFGICVRRTLARVQPTLVVLVELELWPNLILNCRARNVPVVIANGRISEGGFGRMKKISWLLRPFAQRVTRYLMQNDTYAERAVALGVDAGTVSVTGNLKFDREPIDNPATVRRSFEAEHGYRNGQLRWIAGCSHPGEEQVVLEAHKSLRARHPELTLILAPRHVERAGEIEDLIAEQGLTVSRSSRGAAVAADVFLVDEVGLLAQLYACADVAFVGGSLVPRGGHNLLEPVLAGTPAIHGPFMANFRDVVDLLTAGGATVEVADRAELETAVGAWLADQESRRARAALATELLDEHRGVAARTTVELGRFLPITEKVG